MHTLDIYGLYQIDMVLWYVEVFALNIELAAD